MLGTFVVGKLGLVVRSREGLINEGKKVEKAVSKNGWTNGRLCVGIAGKERSLT